jgi:hypothetical protein
MSVLNLDSAIKKWATHSSLKSEGTDLTACRWIFTFISVPFMGVCPRDREIL